MVIVFLAPLYLLCMDYFIIFLGKEAAKAVLLKGCGRVISASMLIRKKWVETSDQLLCAKVFEHP